MPAPSALSHAHLTLMKSGTSNAYPLSATSRFILHHGWAPATTRQYGAAVNKFLLFLDSDGNGEQQLPFTGATVYKFIFWCSTTSTKRVSTGTIKRYLTGLRMWHMLHERCFPLVDLNRVRLLLKACKKTEINKNVPIRIGLNLEDVLHLSEKLTTPSLPDLVTKAVILIGFWGLARLGELTLHNNHPDTFIRRKDLSFNLAGTSATIRLRLAKTSQPGEIQTLRLVSQPNRLDPINVLREVLLRCPGGPNDPLFPGKILGKPIPRSLVSNFLKHNGQEGSYRWSGHSLRIGGASFQNNAGRCICLLKRLGRWRSSVYKTCIHTYSREVKSRTAELARLIHF